MRRVMITLGIVGMLAGVSLISVGLYDSLNSSESAIATQPRVLDYRFDPGGVYDRPAGVLTPTPQPSPTVTPEPTQAPYVAPAPPPPLRDQPFQLVINKIGVNATVFTYGLDDNQVPQVPLNAWDVAWYNFSSRPGTGSNAVFAAHVTWLGPAVFYKLDQLVVGDEIKLMGDDGVELVYVVSDSFLVDPDDPATLSVMRPTDDDVVTLITCGGTFFYTGDPTFGGDYTDRRIVRATLKTISDV
jgi:LPXTG-site transpeptidase (sortase) family protein